MHRNYISSDVDGACKTLGLNKYDINQDQLNRNHKKLSFKYHPDRNITEEAKLKIVEINNARDILQAYIDQHSYFDGHSDAENNYKFEAFKSALNKLQDKKDEKRRVQTFKKNCSCIKNGYELSQALDYFKEEDNKYALALLCKDAVTTIEETKAVISSLQENKRKDFLSKKIALLNHTGKMLDEILALLPANDRHGIAVDLISRHSRSIDVFTAALPHIKQSNRLKIAVQKRALFKTGNDLLTIAACLEESERVVFISKMDLRSIDIVNVKTLIELLFLIPARYQLEFIAAHDQSLVTGDDLVELLSAVAGIHQQESQRYLCLLALKYHAKMTSWALVQHILEKITHESDRYTLLITCLRHLTTSPDHISNVLKLLPESDRDAVYQSISKQIPAHHLIDVLLLVSEPTRCKILAAREPNLDLYDYATLLSSIHEDKRFDLAAAYLNATHLVNVAIVRNFTPLMPENRKRELSDLFIQPETSTPPSVSAETAHGSVLRNSIFTPGNQTAPQLMPSTSLHTSEYKTDVIRILNRYLGRSLLLHEKRVLELRTAVNNADTDDAIKEFIDTQVELLNNGGSHHYEHVYEYLCTEPGKRLISIGYRKMLDDCSKLILPGSSLHKLGYSGVD